MTNEERIARLEATVTSLSARITSLTGELANANQRITVLDARLNADIVSLQAARKQP